MNKNHLNSFSKGMSILDPRAEDQANYTFGLNGRIYSYEKKLAFTSLKGNAIIIPSKEFVDVTKEIVGHYSFGDMVCLITITYDDDVDQIWTFKEDGSGGFNFELKASVDLNLQDGVKLVCRGVKENQVNTTVYFTDGINPLRKANLLDPDLATYTDSEFNLVQNVFLEQPTIKEIGTSGQLMPMNVEYVYRLVNAAGVQTDFSLPSSMISILKTYGQASGEGSLPGIQTGTSVKITISGIDTEIFERIEVYAKEYEVKDVVTDIKTLYDGEITGEEMDFNHLGGESEVSSGLDSALLSVKVLAFDTAEYIETKDNRLFAANLRLRDLKGGTAEEFFLTCKSYDENGNTYEGNFNPDHDRYKYTKKINGNLVRGAESDSFAQGSGIRLTFVTQQELLDKKNPDTGFSDGVTYLTTITSNKDNRSYQREEIYRFMYSLKVKDSVQYSYAEYCCDLKIPSNKEIKRAGDYTHPTGLHQYENGESLINNYSSSFVKKKSNNSLDFDNYGQAVYLKVEYRNEQGLLDLYSDLNILRAIRTDSDKTILDQGIVYPFSRYLNINDNLPLQVPPSYDYSVYDDSVVDGSSSPASIFRRMTIGYSPAPPPGSFFPLGKFSEGPFSFEFEPGKAVNNNVYFLTSATASASQFLADSQLSEVRFRTRGPFNYGLSSRYRKERLGFRPDLLSFDSPLTVVGKQNYDVFQNYKFRIVKRGRRATYFSDNPEFDFDAPIDKRMPYLRRKFSLVPTMFEASNNINVYNGDWFNVDGTESIVENSLFVDENQLIDEGLLGTDIKILNNCPLPISLKNDYVVRYTTTDTSIEVTPCRSSEGINTFVVKTKKGESFTQDHFNHKNPNGASLPPFPNGIVGATPADVYGVRRATTEPLEEGIGSYQANLIVNLTRDLQEQYGGNNNQALVSRGYINCLSLDIKNKTGGSGIVKNGDVYIDVFEYAKHNFSQFKEPYDGEAYGDSRTYYKFNENNNGYLSSLAMILETTVPLDFSVGLSTERTDLHPYDSMGYEYNDAYQSESDLFYYAKSDKQQDLGNNINRCTTIASSEIKINGEFIDAWSKFLPNNFYELDIDKGCIFNLIKLNNELHALQAKSGLSRLYINSRQLIQDNDASNVLIKNTLGDGGPIETHVYISQYGASIKDCYVLSRSYFIYFSDVHKKIILSNGSNVSVLSEELGIQKEVYDDIVSGEIVDVAGYFDEINAECVLSIITDSEKSYSFSYSDIYRKANGFYDFTSSMYIIYDKFIFARNNGNELWQQDAGLYLSFFGETRNFELEFIVNSEFYDSKVFDNFRADIVSLSKATKVEFFTNLSPMQEVLENDSRYRVRENFHVFPYREEFNKDRMRGSYLNVRIIFENKNELISIYNVVSTYRKSFK